MTDGTRPADRRSALFALLLLVPVPSLGTWMAMVQSPGSAGQAVFVAAKIWLLALPLVWLVGVEGGRPRFPRPSTGGMGAACLTGLIIFAVIGCAYGLLGRHWIDADQMRERAIEIGLTTPLIYVAGALYWCTINSFLEEYVWRWFVFTRCEMLMGRRTAVPASGLLFTIHHVIALAVYFDWRITTLASLGIFIGGATWSWLYLTYRNIWAAYVSHVFADVIIFAIGYVLIFSTP